MNIESTETTKQIVLLRHENEELRTKIAGVMEALASLRNASEGFNAVFDGSPDAIVVVRALTDDHGKPTSWTVEEANPTAYRLAGLSRENTPGLRISEFFPSASSDELNHLLASAVRSEGRVAREIQFREPMDTWLSASAWAVPFKSGVALVFHDATQLQVAIEQKEQSEALFELLTQNSTEIVTSHRPDGSYVYVSPAFTALLGYRPEEIIGRSPYEFIHPDDHALVREHHISLLTNTDRAKFTYRIHRKSGEEAWLESVGRIVRHPTTGVVTEIQVGSRDITEKVLVDEVLRGSHYRARAIFEHAGIGIATADMNGELMDANPAFLKMLGYSIDELCTLKIEDITHPDDIASGKNRFAQAIRERRFDTKLNYEKRYIRKNGTAFWARVRASFVTDDKGKPQFNLCMVEDITEQRNADLKLRGLLSELDHRVKNNIASLKAVAEQTLKNSTSLQDFSRSFLGRLNAMSYVHEALSRKQWQDVEVMEIARIAAHGIDAPLQNRLAIEGPAIYIPVGTPQALGMALHELTSNAVRHGALSNEQGDVRLTWSKSTPHTLRLEWRESGGPQVASPVRKGMGLDLIDGLIVYEVGGQVHFDFKPEGLYCTIMIPMV